MVNTHKLPAWVRYTCEMCMHAHRQGYLPRRYTHTQIDTMMDRYEQARTHKRTCAALRTSMHSHTPIHSHPSISSIHQTEGGLFFGFGFLGLELMLVGLWFRGSLVVGTRRWVGDTHTHLLSFSLSPSLSLCLSLSPSLSLYLCLSLSPSFSHIQYVSTYNAATWKGLFID